MHRWQKPNKPAWIVGANRVVLIGQQSSLNCAQHNQAISHDRNHNMSLYRVITPYYLRFGEIDEGKYNRESTHWEDSNPEAFNAAEYTAEQYLDRNKPANQGEGVKKPQVQPRWLVNELVQGDRMQTHRKQGWRQRYPSALGRVTQLFEYQKCGQAI